MGIFILFYSCLVGSSEGGFWFQRALLNVVINGGRWTKVPRHISSYLVSDFEAERLLMDLVVGKAMRYGV